MCEVSVYMAGQNQDEELVMKDVLHVKVDGEEVLLSTLMGESKRVMGRLREIDMENHKVIIEKESENE